jgi:citrate lyase gamma subunit
VAINPEKVRAVVARPRVERAVAGEDEKELAAVVRDRVPAVVARAVPVNHPVRVPKG